MDNPFTVARRAIFADLLENFGGAPKQMSASVQPLFDRAAFLQSPIQMAALYPPTVARVNNVNDFKLDQEEFRAMTNAGTRDPADIGGLVRPGERIHDPQFLGRDVRRF